MYVIINDKKEYFTGLSPLSNAPNYSKLFTKAFIYKDKVNPGGLSPLSRAKVRKSDIKKYNNTDVYIMEIILKEYIE